MRKNAGFMMLTLLLLIVPALANAWTLTVKVAGGTAAQAVTVAYQTSGDVQTTKTLKVGTNYLYPKAGIVLAAAGTPTYKINGVDANLAAVNALAAGPKTVTVTYTPAAVIYNGLTLTQVAGGSIFAQNLNNTWSNSSVAGYVQGALIPVTIAADGNHTITGYTVNGARTAATGKVVSFTVAAAGQTVAPEFGVDAKISASLFAPTNAVAGKTVTLSVAATSNDTGLEYNFIVNGAATGFGASASYSFTAVEGNTVVSAQVRSANSGAVTTAASTIVVANAQTAANSECVSCHSTQSPAIVAAYNGSIHGESTHSACASCHTAATPHSAGINAVNVNKSTFVVTNAVAGLSAPVAAGAVLCSGCHTGAYAIPHQTTNLNAGFTCNGCHTSETGVAGNGDAHSIKGLSCIGCHSVGQQNPFSDKTLVNDNNGVRSITNEFAKWSHHVTGVDLQDAHCAACHLEGKVSHGAVVVDATKHMVDNKTHLRNADTDADLQWDPANPSHSTMDTFCMTCHDANGATSPVSVAIQAVIVPAAGKTASPSNPFGDTISNRYDKMQRPAVVNVDDQFDTTNNSHHAVKGPRYSGRTRAGAERVIASPATFANNSTAALYGARSTIFDAGNFNALYVPLADAAGEAAPRTGAASLGDDSTLHCGDCHTVGQFRAADVNLAAASFNKAVIGAHGSNNEYMLRNSSGTDVRHTQNAYVTTAGIVNNTKTDNLLVCFNCHSFNKYGSAFNSSASGHSGEYGSGGRCNGPGNTIPFNGYTTGTATDGTQFVSRFDGPLTKYSAATTYAEQNPDFGNVLGIQCANCHNSGVENGYGGIHGSKINTYTDGMGNTTKMERFLPGLGNTKYVPGTVGGISGGTTATGIYGPYTTGGVSSDTNWEQKLSKWNGTTGAYAGAGCYTLSDGATAATSGQTGLSVDGGLTIPEAFGTWGGCDDHGAAVGAGDHGINKKIIRPVTY